MLKKESIDFSITEHEPLFTVEDSKLMRGKIEGGHSKNKGCKHLKRRELSKTSNTLEKPQQTSSRKTNT